MTASRGDELDPTVVHRAIIEANALKLELQRLRRPLRDETASDAAEISAVLSTVDQRLDDLINVLEDLVGDQPQ
jgi:regulator of replication initiation timing